jgi:hypothetical protein
MTARMLCRSPFEASAVRVGLDAPPGAGRRRCWDARQATVSAHAADRSDLRQRHRVRRHPGRTGVSAGLTLLNRRLQVVRRRLLAAFIAAFLLGDAQRLLELEAQ